ncbi:hypothetical protein RRG08_024997 [Elysia crispata]|uniref:Uncharacterized protein n=1 Tax=Elysia crispata TaxID=231223 RepID=A0AAE1BE58_9GAST|nr:hypothetical protein RRG08_024997 [Elysia crispata]
MRTESHLFSSVVFDKSLCSIVLQRKNSQHAELAERTPVYLSLRFIPHQNVPSTDRRAAQEKGRGGRRRVPQPRGEPVKLRQLGLLRREK